MKAEYSEVVISVLLGSVQSGRVGIPEPVMGREEPSAVVPANGGSPGDPALRCSAAGCRGRGAPGRAALAAQGFSFDPLIHVMAISGWMNIVLSKALRFDMASKAM